MYDRRFVDLDKKEQEYAYAYEKKTLFGLIFDTILRVLGIRKH